MLLLVLLLRLLLLLAPRGFRIAYCTTYVFIMLLLIPLLRLLLLRPFLHLTQRKPAEGSALPSLIVPRMHRASPRAFPHMPDR